MDSVCAIHVKRRKVLLGISAIMAAVCALVFFSFQCPEAFAEEGSETQLVAVGLGQSNDSIEAELVPTVENGVEYKTHVEYTDYANSGKISWGEVSLFKTEPDANGVVFWFFTNPDKANHPNEVQLSFIDRTASNESEFDLVIPSNVTVQGTTYKVTAVGPESGSSYKEYAGNQCMLAYWYDPIDEFAPDWCIGPNAKTVGDMTKDSEGYLDFAIAHPYMPVAGQNPNISAYGPVRYDADAVRNGIVNENSPQAFKDYIKPTFTNKVKSLYIPSTVETIGGNCFASWGISSLAIADSSNLKNIDGGAFMGCKQLETLDFSTTKLASIMAPQYYRLHVSGDARGYTGTEDLDGDGTINAQDAWYDEDYGKWTNTDGALSDNPVEYTDRSVGGYAPFANCSLLRAVSFPSGVRLGITIEAVFSGCSSLEELNIVGNETELVYREKEFKRTGNYVWHSYKLVDGLLLNLDQNCTAIDWIPPAMETVVIPDSVTTFKYPDSANVNNWTTPFFNGSSAKSHAKKVVLGQGITEITSSALCSSYLEEVVLSNSVTTINEKAFSGATSLKSVELPNSVTSIGKQAFSKCSALEYISIPGSVLTLGAGAFQNCTSLTTVVLADGIETIGNQVFYGTAIKSLTIPDSVVSFGTNVVTKCNDLEMVSFGKGMSSFPNNALSNTKSLKTVMISGANPIQYSGTLIACLKAEFANIPEEISLYYLEPIDSIEDENWNQAFGANVTNLGAKKLNVYGVGERLKGYFGNVIENPPSYFTDSTGDNTEKASVTYTDIGNGIVKVGAGTDWVAIAGLPSDAESVEYTGSAVTFNLTATYGTGDDAVTLTEGTDYTVEYADNMKPGTATVTVRGMGDYIGTMTAEFQIVDTEDGKAAADEEAVKALVDDVANLPAADEITADNPDAIAAVEDAVSAYSSMNDVQKADIGADTLSALVTAQAKVAEAKQQIADEALQAEKEAKEAAQKEAAEAQAQVEQLKADVEAAKAQAAAASASLAKAQAAASASLAKPALTAETKSKKKGKLTAAWSRVAGADGYELKVGKKTYTVKGGAKLSKTVKAKKGKKAKVQVRAFKRQGDNTVYSAWSKAKKVKVKR